MRGVWYVLESVMAVLVMVGFLAAINVAYFTKPYGSDMAFRAHVILEGMDNRGVLRNYTESLNHTAITEEIKAYKYNMSTLICDYAGSCVGTSPNSSNVWVATYLVAGLSSYQPREIRLHVWPR